MSLARTAIRVRPTACLIAVPARCCAGSARAGGPGPVPAEPRFMLPRDVPAGPEASMTLTPPVRLVTERGDDATLTPLPALHVTPEKP